MAAHDALADRILLRHLARGAMETVLLEAAEDDILDPGAYAIGA